MARATLRQNILVMLVSQALTWAISAVTLTLLPRYLGPADLGQFSIAVTFQTLAVTAGGLGMYVLMTREVARDRARASALLPTAAWLHVLLGLVAGVVFTGLAAAAGYPRAVVTLVAINALALPFTQLTTLAYGVLQGAEVMRYQAAFDVGGKLLNLAATIAIIHFDLGLTAFFVVGVPLAALSALPLCGRVFRVLDTSPWRFAPGDARYLLRGSLPFFASGVLFVVYNTLDVMLLSWLAGEEAVGIYATPMRLFGTLMFATTVLSYVIFPRLATTYAHDREEFARLGRVAFQLVLAGTLAISLLAYGLSDARVVGIIGEGFGRSAAVVVLVAIVLVPTSLNTVANRLLVAADREFRWTLLQGAGLVAKAGCGLALIPLFEGRWQNPALGAAVALLAAELLISVVALRSLPLSLVRGAVVLYEKLLAALLFAICAAILLQGSAGPLGAALAAVGVYLLTLAFLQVLTPGQARVGLRWLAGRGALPGPATTPEPLPDVEPRPFVPSPLGEWELALRQKPNRSLR